MDGGRHFQLVDEAHPQTLALAAAQLHTGRPAAVGPGRGDVPRQQLQVERRGDQLVVVGRHIFRAPQPVAHTAGAEAYGGQTEQASENLSTCK
ncbi:hypothetical protein D3C72_2001710 [compost metagenome]